MKRLFSSLLAALAIAGASSQASAQQADARDFELGYFAPNNALAVNVYARHESATVKRNLSSSSAILRATHILKKGDWAFAPIDVLVPMADATVYTPAAAGSPANVAIHASGFGDFIWVPTIGRGWVQNAQIHTHTWVALTSYVNAPTGTYDPNKLLNIGTNRWLIRPQLTVGQRFAKAFTLEAYVNVGIVTDNTAYRLPGQVIQAAASAAAMANPAAGPATAAALSGNKTLTTDMSINAGLLAAMDISPTFYLSASYYYLKNGKQEV